MAGRSDDGTDDRDQRRGQYGNVDLARSEVISRCEHVRGAVLRNL